jgi:hypothetical protein
MSKSFTSMEQKVCLVTGKTYDSGNLLIAKNLNQKLDMRTTTGWGYCPEVQEKLDQGYVALVGADMSKSELQDNGNVSPEDAYRTGDVIYMRREAAKRILNFKDGLDMSFIDTDVVKFLEKLQKDSLEEE